MTSLPIPPPQYPDHEPALAWFDAALRPVPAEAVQEVPTSVLRPTAADMPGFPTLADRHADGGSLAARLDRLADLAPPREPAPLMQTMTLPNGRFLVVLSSFPEEYLGTADELMLTLRDRTGAAAVLHFPHRVDVLDAIDYGATGGVVEHEGDEQAIAELRAQHAEALGVARGALRQALDALDGAGDLIALRDRVRAIALAGLGEVAA